MTDMTPHSRENPRCPETKAVPETIRDAFDEFMGAFDQFREANDRRLAEIERKQSADTLSNEKVDRINAALDEHKKVLDDMLVSRGRPHLGAGAASELEHKRAFEAYVRRGDETGLKLIEAKALSAGIPAEGGYVVPAETDSEIARRLALISPIRALATVRQISSSVLRKPVGLTGMASGWVSEKAARPETAASQLGELAFETMELYAMPAATQSLLDDAAIDIEAWIAAEVDIAFAEQESQAFVLGDGVAKPKGFLKYDLVDESVWSWGKIGYVPTGKADGFADDGPLDVLVDAAHSLKASHRQAARFAMNRTTQAMLRKVKDADGKYLWQPPATIGGEASLIGFPVTEVEHMPNPGAGLCPIAVADFAAAYLVVDRVGVRILRDPYSAKPYVLFYATKRVGGGVQDFEAIKLVRIGVD